MSTPLPILKLRMNKRGRWVAGMREDAPLGIFGIDQQKLRNNILSICRLTTKKKVNGFPNCKVSSHFKFLLLELIQGIKPSSEDMDKLDEEEQDYLQQLIKASHITGLEEIKDSITNTQLKRKLYVNMGQIDSGNDSAELQKETKMLLKIVKKRGLLNDLQVEHISREFNL